MTKKAGIFDPWRQAEPPPLQNAKRSVDGTDAPTTRHCVQFDGLRAGVHVWILPPDDEEEYSAHARNQLVAAVNKLAATEAAPILKSWSVFVGPDAVPCDNQVVVKGTSSVLTISSPENGVRLVPRAIDTLALALREVQQASIVVAEVLAGQFVKPYVK